MKKFMAGRSCRQLYLERAAGVLTVRGLISAVPHEAQSCAIHHGLYPTDADDRR